MRTRGRRRGRLERQALSGAGRGGGGGAAGAARTAAAVRAVAAMRRKGGMGQVSSARRNPLTGGGLPHTSGHRAAVKVALMGPGATGLLERDGELALIRDSIARAAGGEG